MCWGRQQLPKQWSYLVGVKWPVLSYSYGLNCVDHAVVDAVYARSGCKSVILLLASANKIRMEHSLRGTGKLLNKACSSSCFQGFEKETRYLNDKFEWFRTCTDGCITILRLKGPGRGEHAVAIDAFSELVCDKNHQCVLRLSVFKFRLCAVERPRKRHITEVCEIAKKTGGFDIC